MRANSFGQLRALARALLGVPLNASAAFESFRLSLRDGEPAAGAELDAEALAALRGRERRIAETLLLRALPAPRAIAGLSDLASPRAHKSLAALFAQECAGAQAASAAGREREWSGETLLAVALALWRIAPQERYARVVMGRLRHAASARERADAALALAFMPGAEADAALLEALEDADAIVRHCAARAWLEVQGVSVDGCASRRLIRHVAAREAHPCAAWRREIEAAFAGRRSP